MKSKRGSAELLLGVMIVVIGAAVVLSLQYSTIQRIRAKIAPFNSLAGHYTAEIALTYVYVRYGIRQSPVPGSLPAAIRVNPSIRGSSLSLHTPMERFANLFRTLSDFLEPSALADDKGVNRHPGKGQSGNQPTGGQGAPFGTPVPGGRRNGDNGTRDLSSSKIFLPRFMDNSAGFNIGDLGASGTTYCGKWIYPDGKNSRSVCLFDNTPPTQTVGVSATPTAPWPGSWASSAVVDYNAEGYARWDTQFMKTCSFYNAGDVVSSELNQSSALSVGRIVANPTTFTLQCVGRNRTPMSAQVSFCPKPGINFTASSSTSGPWSETATVPLNTNGAIQYTTQVATTCSLSPIGWTDLQKSPSEVGPIVTNPTPLTLTCTNSCGSTTKTVTFIPSIPPPTLTVEVAGIDGTWGNSKCVDYNTNGQIRWSSQYTQNCLLEQVRWTGVSRTASSIGPIRANPTPLTVTCTGLNGNRISSTVYLNAKPDVVFEASDRVSGGTWGPTASVSANTNGAIRYQTQLADSCSVSPISWTFLQKTATEVGPIQTDPTTLTLSCTNSCGPTTKQVTFNLRNLAVCGFMGPRDPTCLGAVDARTLFKPQMPPGTPQLHDSSLLADDITLRQACVLAFGSGCTGNITYTKSILFYNDFYRSCGDNFTWYFSGSAYNWKSACLTNGTQWMDTSIICTCKP